MTDSRTFAIVKSLLRLKVLHVTTICHSNWINIKVQLINGCIWSQSLPPPAPSSCLLSWSCVISVQWHWTVLGPLLHLLQEVVSQVACLVSSLVTVASDEESPTKGVEIFAKFCCDQHHQQSDQLYSLELCGLFLY